MKKTVSILLVLLLAMGLLPSGALAILLAWLQWKREEYGSRMNA